MTFDKYLVEQGFSIWNPFDHQSLSKIPAYSTMGLLAVDLIKDDVTISYGLCEIAPPTLIYPRPFLFRKIENKYAYWDERALLDRYLFSLTNEELLDRIKNDKPWAIYEENEQFYEFS